MYVLGAIFAALWFTGIWLARRLQVPSAPGLPPAPSDPPETEAAAPGTHGS
jgi:hypothetical protein